LEGVQLVLERMAKTKSNKEFLETMNQDR